MIHYAVMNTNTSKKPEREVLKHCNKTSIANSWLIKYMFRRMIYSTIHNCLTETTTKTKKKAKQLAEGRALSPNPAIL